MPSKNKQPQIPHPPTERMAILELRAAQGWSLEQGQPGVRIKLAVSYQHSRKHLPVATIRRAA